MRRPGFSAKFAFLLSGLLIWALHFLFVYGVNGLACARGFAGNEMGGFGVVPLTVLAATAVALAFQGAILLVAYAGHGPGIHGEQDNSLGEFWRFTTAALAALSLVAVVWTGLPALFIHPCA